MVFNPAQFVFEPRPQPSVDFSRGSQLVVNALNARKQREQNESQYARTRSDTQSQFSANFAKQRADDEFTKETDRYNTQLELIARARAAAQRNDQAAADAAVPSIRALGGTATRSIGAGGLPEYVFQESARPTRPELDFSGTRRSIYGLQGPSVSAPFQVPGFGADGERNPFAPSALPGASAAQLPATAAPPAPAAGDPGPPPGAAVDDAGPPPGAAVDGPRTPPEGAVWLPPEATSAPAATQTSAEADLAALESIGEEPADTTVSPGATAQPVGDAGGNPYEAPAFSPYRIAIADVRQRNQDALNPYLEGLVSASPTGLRERMSSYAGGLSGLGLTPEDSIKLSDKTVEQLFSNYRGEVNARAAAGRAELGMEQRREDRAWAEAQNVINNEDLKATKRKLNEARGAFSLLKSAATNPQSARDLITSLYRMKNTGVMTDQDFQYASKGMVSLWGAIKDGALNKFFNLRGGLNPAQIREIKELLDVGLHNLRKTMSSARDKLYEGYHASTTDGQRAGWNRAIRTLFDKEYLPEGWVSSSGAEEVPSEEEFRQQNPNVVVEGEEEEPYTPSTDHDPTSGPPPLGGDNLGVAPLPKDPPGRRPIPQRGAGAKPPRGRPRTRAEVEELMRKAEEELNAP